ALSFRMLFRLTRYRLFCSLFLLLFSTLFFFFFQAEDGIRDRNVTGVKTCALPILPSGVTAKLTASKDKGWYPHHHGGHRQYGTGQGRGSVTKPCGNHRTTNGGPGSVGQIKCRVV